MRRAVVIAALAACVFAGLAGGLPEASADNRSSDSRGNGWGEFRQELQETRLAVRTASTALEAGSWRQDECRFQSLRRGTWTAIEEQLTAECAVRKWSVGGYTKFYSMADCESHWNRMANNAGRYLGLFQHAAAYWWGRVRTYNPDHWDRPLDPRWTNSRTQIVVTAKMVAAQGWGAWSCA